MMPLLEETNETCYSIWVAMVSEFESQATPKALGNWQNVYPPGPG